jgi:hypothetical protein
MTDNTKELAEIEAIEREIEPLPDSSGLITTTKSSAEDIFWLADNIEKIIQSQNKIRLAILKLAQPGDWVVFGDDAAKKAEIGFAGANRIGATLGISFKNWNAEKIKESDEKGEYYRWEFTCDAIFRNTEIRVYGRASSRDKFFGKAHGAWKPLHDIKEDDIKCAAMRAAKKEGVRDLLGLHHLDPDFLTKNGVILSSAGGHSFKGQDAAAAETNSVNVTIENVLMKSGTNKESGKPWVKYTVVDAEGVEYATFSETVAKLAKAAKESKAVAKIDFTKDKWGLAISSFNGETGGAK